MRGEGPRPISNLSEPARDKVKQLASLMTSLSEVTKYFGKPWTGVWFALFSTDSRQSIEHRINIGQTLSETNTTNASVAATLLPCKAPLPVRCVIDPRWRFAHSKT